ncbi:hypothetical protein M378DRAFT_81621 [Amanita muscaria Koide BX008]|uniref:HNH nuclease domain-containing protein n=1 Tax=Amanita muscaria (strain Koide BX008) TaxID=946122 RepID=A0A0C2WKU3_AMAMK|nr:hypothetical protein M378DRAFT_81621 [Amanita muscaria Koide BX008]
MAPLPTFGLPLPQLAPPIGYGRSDHDLSALSTTTAFHTRLDQRDQFLGICRCVVCGDYGVVEHCHAQWKDLKKRRWIPSLAKALPRHEPRDGMIMCATHHRQFDSYFFFIRFFPDIRKFVFINYSGHEYLQQFHGKAIAIDIKDRYAPFPSLFIIHEMRVRGFHPFQPVAPTVPDDILWQDWISSGQVFDNASNSFKHDSLPPNDNDRSAEAQLPFHPMTTASSSQRTLALNADVIADILAATRAMPSWKACEVEGTSWTGTAEENIQKYISSIGAQDG